MCRIILIRHGETYGNTFHRYIGLTDESLTKNGIDKIKNNIYPSADYVYSSPLKRCTETACIIYKKYNIDVDLIECNFGKYENKSHKDLEHDKDYIEFLNMGENAIYPNGESIKSFKKRAVKSLNKYIDKYKNTDYTISLITHGGIIMSILSYYFEGNYYDYNLKNGEYYSFDINDKGFCLNLKRGDIK